MPVLAEIFAGVLEQTIQPKMEQLFKEAFAKGSPLAKKLEARIEEGFRRFIKRGGAPQSRAR